MGIEKDERNNYSIQVPFEHQHYPKKVDFTTEIMRDEGGATWCNKRRQHTSAATKVAKYIDLAKMAE
jgi:hypothetical protein